MCAFTIRTADVQKIPPPLLKTLGPRSVLKNVKIYSLPSIPRQNMVHIVNCAS